MPEKTVQDHKGNVFKSQREMCKYWNMSYSAFNARRNRGNWSLKDSLETPVKEMVPRRDLKPKVDHQGNVFSSFEKLCEHWGKPPSTVHSRLMRGSNIKEALEAPILERSKAVVDHKGNRFKNTKEMCKQWGVNPSTYMDRRRRLGLSVREALEAGPFGVNKVTDHEGNTFSSFHKMCEHWGFNGKQTRIIYGRINNLKWSLKKALETPITPRKVEINNGLGELLDKSFDRTLQVLSRKELARREYPIWKINQTKQLGKTAWLKFISADLVAYYRVPWSKELKTTREIVEHELPELLERYDKANPNGIYVPMVGTVNPGYRQLEREMLHGKVTLEQLLKRFNCTIEQFNTRIKGGASVDEAITGKKDILILREQGQKDKV